jgi:hypothetical protein
MQKQVSLGPGETKTVSFTVIPTAAGVYNVSIGNLVGSFECMPSITDWTPGITVGSVEVLPSVVHVGDEVNIRVHILYPCPSPLPVDIQGMVFIDGIALTETMTIQSYDPLFLFRYIATEPGTFTIRAQEKTATLDVIQGEVGTYYSPFGGVRMPICTDLLIPNAAPGGGDLLFSSLPPSPAGYPVIPYLYYGHGPSLFSVPNNATAAVKAQLPNARPAAWDPPDVTVNECVTYFEGGPSSSILVMAAEYTCKEYWGSEGELALMIGTNLGGMGAAIPDAWVLNFGTTCPICGGTGQVPCTSSNRLQYHCTVGSMMTCRTCGGLGKILRVDLYRGLRDSAKPITYTSTRIGTTNHYIPYIACPYCGTLIEGPTHVGGTTWDELSLVRDLLTHIKTVHPTHPLTSPAWY